MPNHRCRSRRSPESSADIDLSSTEGMPSSLASSQARSRRSSNTRHSTTTDSMLTGTTAVSDRSGYGSSASRQPVPSSAASDGSLSSSSTWRNVPSTSRGLSSSHAASESRSSRHSHTRSRSSRTAANHRPHGSSRHSRNTPTARSSRAPSHRPFTPATFAPSEYLGQRRNDPASTVGPWDSNSQAPTHVSTRGRALEPRGSARNPQNRKIEIVARDNSCSRFTHKVPQNAKENHKELEMLLYIRQTYVYEVEKSRQAFVKANASAPSMTEDFNSYSYWMHCLLTCELEIACINRAINNRHQDVWDSWKKCRGNGIMYRVLCRPYRPTESMTEEKVVEALISTFR